MIQPAFGPSGGATHTTLREKWSMATNTWRGHRPQPSTFVVSADHTWLGYQAGIERPCGFSFAFSVVAAPVLLGQRRLGGRIPSARPGQVHPRVLAGGRPTR
jgi:hypothetical protein